MRTPAAAKDGVLLLQSISKRLDALGFPPASSPNEELPPEFCRLQSDINRRIRDASNAGVDLSRAFEINEAKISRSARSLAQRWYESDGKLDSSDLTWLSRRPKLTNREPQKWFKKVLLQRERQISDFFYMCQAQIGSSSMPIVSDAVLASKQRQNAQAEKFAAEHQFESATNGSTIAMPFQEAASSAKKRSAKLYAHAVGLEKYCTKVGLQGYFVTLTLPGRYHPNPKTGHNTWTGFTHIEGHDELQRRWRQLQRETSRIFGKMLGVRVEEPHTDGCPHWHLLIYIDVKHEEAFRKLIAHFFGDSHAAEVVAIDPQKGKGASYVMKYILPVLNAEADTTAARYQAHRSAWGKRAIQFFDRPGSSTLWDEIRRIKPDSNEFMGLSKYAAQLHAAACANDYCEFLCLLDSNNAPKQTSISEVDCIRTSKKRVGIWYSEKPAVVDVIRTDAPRVDAKKILGLIDHGACVNTHLLNWTIERKSPEELLELQTEKNRVWALKCRGIVAEKIGNATVMHSYPRIYELGGKTPKPVLGSPQLVTRTKKLAGIQGGDLVITLSCNHHHGFSHSGNVCRSISAAMEGVP